MARELAGPSKSYPWSSNGDRNDNGGFSLAGEFQNQLQYEFVHQENVHNCSFFLPQCHEAANKRIMDTRKENSEQEQLAGVLLKLPPFGLKLNLAPNFLDSLEKMLNHYSSAAKKYDFGSQPMSEKLKASSFPVFLLKIGNWERRSTNEGDLVAKCYYAKKRLVWEILERRLKSKIEIQWNDIIAMRAIIRENQPGILEIELNQPPTFHEETDPQPRKHTMWKPTSDFTGGEASKCRRHQLMFPPGSLDKHYEKLIHCDRRFYELCQKPFPSLRSPCFESNIYRYTNFTLDNHMDRPNANHGLQFNHGTPSPQVAVQHVPSNYHACQPSFQGTPSPISVMEFSHSNEIIKRLHDNPRMALWGEGTSNNLAAAPIVVPFNQVDSVVSFQNYSNPLPYYGQGGNPNNHVNQMLSNVNHPLFSDTMVEGYNETNQMASVDSLNGLVNLFQEGSSQQTFYGQGMVTGNNGLGLDYSVNPSMQNFGGQVFQQPDSSIPSQVHPSMQNFGPFNNDINQFKH
ncbi:hypothetical protein MANES_09G176500v8 [Manihot esculenta]|uniref:Uncharacterized protein n=1 Tax=Manihot esculenta TaxID=3983 RepID=A0ACB7H7B1_MANES|nr:hypothetical protein MANES_09G176500v8 [Manihot esculenta]